MIGSFSFVTHGDIPCMRPCLARLPWTGHNASGVCSWWGYRPCSRVNGKDVRRISLENTNLTLAGFVFIRAGSPLQVVLSHLLGRDRPGKAWLSPAVRPIIAHGWTAVAGRLIGLVWPIIISGRATAISVCPTGFGA